MGEIRKSKTGRVVSDKMQKTVVVAVETRHRHRLYHKLVRRTHRFKAHDEANRCRVGDLVRIVETRPLSKEKHWRVAQILGRGEYVEPIREELESETEESETAESAE